jgi:hypothetical protein
MTETEREYSIIGVSVRETETGQCRTFKAGFIPGAILGAMKPNRANVPVSALSISAGIIVAVLALTLLSVLDANGWQFVGHTAQFWSRLLACLFYQ